MKNIYILNTCDFWHTWTSMCPIGYWATFELAILHAKRHSKKFKNFNKDANLDKNGDQLAQLRDIRQTQGLPDHEYFIEEVELNTELE